MEFFGKFSVVTKAALFETKHFYDPSRLINFDRILVEVHFYFRHNSLETILHKQLFSFLFFELLKWDPLVKKHIGNLLLINSY